VLAAVLLVVLGTPAAAAPPAEAAVGPGTPLLTPLGGRDATACTANFVFTDGEAVYLGSAAHCAAAGAATDVSGCTSPALPVGSTVLVGAAQLRGRLAYSSWVTMQGRGETDADLCLHNDFALVALPPGTPVDPSVPRVGGPTGLDVDGTRPDEPVVGYQPRAGAPVRSGRSLGELAGGRAHRVETDPPGGAGDSGSGYLDGDGEALGVLSTLTSDGTRSTNGVTDLARALDYLAVHGGRGPVALVPGD
jgi:hypothetical protein